MADTTICSACGQEKPRFNPTYKVRTRKCESCYRQGALDAVKRYTASHREEVTARGREWTRRNKDRLNAKRRDKTPEQRERKREQDQRYYWANREILNAQSRQYKQANRETLAQKYREYYAKNRDKMQASNRRWKANNLVRWQSYQDQYSIDNRERRLRYGVQYREANRDILRRRSREMHRLFPEMDTARASRRKARMPLQSIPRGWKAAQFIRQGGRCAGCARHFTRKRKAAIDHIRPIQPKNGGPPGDNSPENLQLLCQPCNSSKGNRSEHEWRRRFRGQLI